MSSRSSYNPLLCNLCWDELQEPFIVTSCQHCFCMKHEHDQRIKQSTCPGCGNHLPHKGGLNVARFRVQPDQVNTLNGLQPDSVLQLAGNAIQFWVSQERTHAEYLRHLYSTMKKSKDDQKDSFKAVHGELTQELSTVRQQKDQAEAREDDLKHEMRALEEKYQEETRRVRILQEKMIGTKRPGRADASPMHGAPLTPERSHHGSPVHHSAVAPLRGPSPMLRNPSPTIHQQPYPPLARLPSPTPHRAPFESSSRLGGAFGGGGGSARGPSLGLSGGLGGGSSRGGLSAPFPQMTTPATSRHDTPVHRSSSFSRPPTLGTGPSWGGRR